jgi:long-subunit fatty acid transport protein
VWLQVLVLAVCLGCGIGGARALSDEELYRDFRFQFITPGARSVALGGAFTAIADDATAAAANPAGLDYLTAPNAFAEIRSISADTQTIRSSLGSTALDPDTSLAELPYLDLEAVSDPDDVTELSFVSFSWPFELARWGRRMVVSGSRQVLFSHERSLDASGTGTRASLAFDTFPNVVVGDEIQAYSVDTVVTGDLDANVVYWNAAVSYEVHEDFSVGVTLTYARLDMDGHSTTQVIDPEQLLLDPTHPRLAGQTSSDFLRTDVDDTDSDFTYTIGIHWHPNSVYPDGRSPWRLGAVVRQGASFSVKESVSINDIPERSFDNRVVVPDRWALGISYRTPQHWLFSAEWERVQYSDLMQGYETGVNYLTSERLAEASFNLEEGRNIEFDISDGNIVRAGAEYLHLLGGDPGRRLTVQAGYFRSPEDRIRMTRFHSNSSEVNETYREAFPGANDENHFTAGVGLTWGAYSFQIAAETSDLGDQVVGSFGFDLTRRGDK